MVTEQKYLAALDAGDAARIVETRAALTTAIETLLESDQQRLLGLDGRREHEREREFLRDRIAALENSCKHVAAAYYMLAERFDEDPFLIFAWRGRDRDELLERLRARRGACSGPGSEATRSATAEPRTVALPEQLDSFWRSGPTLADLYISPPAG